MSDNDEPRVIVEKRSAGIGMLLIGLVVGAGVALLLAPQSGMETRRRLARGARRVRRVAEDAAGDVSERVGEKFDEARERVSERVSEHVEAAREVLASKRSKVTRAMSAGREAAAQARVDLETRLAQTKAAYEAGARVAREQSTRGD
jgi:gas vesicle protein